MAYRTFTTDKELIGLVQRAVPQIVSDGKTPRLHVRVWGPSQYVEGRGTWFVAYQRRLGGKKQGSQIVLGYYPQLTLAGARTKAALVNADIDNGIEPPPSQQLRTRKRARISPAPERPKGIKAPLVLPDDGEPFLAGSFGALAADYVRFHLPKKRRPQADLTAIRTYLLPYWRNVPMTALDRPRIIHRLDQIAATGSDSAHMRKMRATGKRHRSKPAPIQADRIGALVSVLCTFALNRGGWFRPDQGHPALRLPKYDHRTPEEREAVTESAYLTEARLVTFWRALVAEAETDPVVAAALWLETLIGQRGGEILGMQWSEIEGDWWTIPGSRAKNHRLHRVPIGGALAQQVLASLRAQATSSVYVFPSKRPGTTESELGPLTHETRSYRAALKRIRQRLNFTWRPHDLRRTVITNLARLGVPEEHLRQLVNHKGGSVTEIHYNRYRYDEAKLAAIRLWDAEVQRILSAARLEPMPTTASWGKLLLFPKAA